MKVHESMLLTLVNNVKIKNHIKESSSSSKYHKYLEHIFYDSVSASTYITN